MTLYRFADIAPSIHASAYVAPNASVIGNVTLAAHSSVWFGVTLRGDNEPIRIGERSNVQDGTVMHTDPGFPLTIAAEVTIGHQAMLHGCTVGEGSLIGIQAIILNGAVIGKSCLVAAGAVVTERKAFADRSLIVGAPARVVRELSDEEVARLLASASNYVQRAAAYRGKLAAL